MPGKHRAPHSFPVRPVLAAVAAAGVLVSATAAFGAGGFTPPCTDDDSFACVGKRLDALEGWAATVQPGSTVTQTATATATATATVTSTPKPTTATPTPTPTPTVTTQPSTGDLPYSAGSYFKSVVQPAKIDAGLTQSFRTFMATNTEQKGTPYPVIRGVDGNKWGTVYAEGHATDPVWKLTGSVPAEVSVLKTQGFHAPESLGSQLTGTSDSPFVVYDKASGWSIWAAKAAPGANHTISVGAAGLFEHNSNGLDKRNPLSDSALNFRSRGAIPDAMVIRADLMAKAIRDNTGLGHVLHLFFVETDSSAGFVSPMVGAESSKNGWGAEGQRLAIDPAVNLEARNCTPQGLVIARTLQTNGTYIGDNSGGVTGLKAQQETGGVWGGALNADELKGCVTWADFVAVRN